MLLHVFARFMVLAASLQGLKRRNSVLVIILATDLSLESQSPHTTFALHQEVKIDQPITTSATGLQFQPLPSGNVSVALTDACALDPLTSHSQDSVVNTSAKWWAILQVILAFWMLLDLLKKVRQLLSWGSELHAAFSALCFANALQRRGQWTLLASHFNLSHSQFLLAVVVP